MNRMQRRAVFCVVALLLCGRAVSLFAAPDTESKIKSLEQRISELSSQLEQIKSEQKTVATVDNAVLEKRVRELEARMAERAADEAPFTAGYKSGFVIQSADGKHRIKLGGRVQTDGIWQAGAGAARSGSVDGFLLRRARLSIQGRLYKHFNFKIEPNWDKGSPGLKSMYTDITYFNPVNLKMGLFKPPISHEDLQSSGDIHLMERSLLNSLVPDHDIGVMFHGKPWKLFEYQVAYMNGLAKPASSDADDDEDVLVRIMLTPFGNSKNKWLKNLAFGGSFSWGLQHVDIASAPAHKLKTPAGNTYYEFLGELHGQRTRYGAELMYYGGPFHLNAEMLTVEQHVAVSESELPSKLFITRSWYVETGYVITGEDSSYKGVKPKKNFDPRNGTWGAFEVSLRYSTMMPDDTAIEQGYAKSSKYNGADEYGAGLTWYLNPKAKIMLLYDHVVFGSSPCSSSDSRTEDSAMFRFQLNI